MHPSLLVGKVTLVHVSVLKTSVESTAGAGSWWCGEYGYVPGHQVVDTGHCDGQHNRMQHCGWVLASCNTGYVCITGCEMCVLHNVTQIFSSNASLCLMNRTWLERYTFSVSTFMHKLKQPATVEGMPEIYWYTYCDPWNSILYEIWTVIFKIPNQFSSLYIT